MANFDAAIMPVTPRFGSTGGPRTNTQIAHAGGGHRKTNRRWSQYLRHLELDYNKAISSGGTDVTVHAIAKIWDAVGGPENSFLARDWSRWNTSSDQRQSGLTAVAFDDMTMQNTTDDTFVGDGTTTVFRLVDRSVEGSASHAQKIEKPQQGTLKFGVNGVEVFEGSPTDLSVDYATGRVTFQTAPGASQAVTWGGAWYLPVAFVEDSLTIAMRTFETSRVGFPLIQVRL